MQTFSLPRCLFAFPPCILDVDHSEPTLHHSLTGSHSVNDIFFSLRCHTWWEREQSNWKQIEERGQDVVKQKLALTLGIAYGCELCHGTCNKGGMYMYNVHTMPFRTEKIMKRITSDFCSKCSHLNGSFFLWRLPLLVPLLNGKYPFCVTAYADERELMYK